jgi:hypothetical protein
MNSTQTENNDQDGERRISPHQLFLIGLLGVVFVIVIVVSILVLNRPQSEIQNTATVQQMIAQQTEIDRTLTPTNTISPTPGLTFTPKPTRTPTNAPPPTASPQPTLLPSITPAYPSEHNDQYELILWTPELADDLIEILEVYPDTLSSYARGDDNQGYYDAFQYALFAQREALLRFPSASQADVWQWQLAYNLARTGNQSAGEVYANLITQELNRADTTLDDLYTWGLKQTPPLLIESFPLDAGDNALSSELVKVTAEENGSAYFWLIERTTGYTSNSLTSNFDFIRPNQIDNFIISLLASTGEVVGTFPTKIYESLHYRPPSVFSLVTQPPEQLSFALFSPPAIGPDFTNNWQPIAGGDGQGDLQFVDVVFPACPVTVSHFYEWNGLEFVFLEDTYAISPDPDLLSYCEFVVNHSINTWGLEPTIQLMETLLPVWPPETTTTGKDYPEDALDEWRYRLSIYHALLANQEQSIEYAQLIIDDPASPDSRWIEPASDLLATYHTQRDIYRVCINSEYCNPRMGFDSLIRTITIEEHSDLNSILEQAGVDIRSSGLFNFDNSAESERWLIVRHQTGTPLEFWIISPNEVHLQSLFVTTVNTHTPQLSYLEPISEPPIVLLEPDFTFHYIRIGPENEPVIVQVEPEVVFSSDLTEMDLDYLEEILLTGGDPAFVQEELIILSKSPHFTCSFLLCPRFLYLLGLASELANDEYSAVAVYLDLWRQYPGHPYTIMARYKLGSTLEPTPTLVPTTTSTTTPSSGETSTATTTPTPTNTVTPEGYTPPGYPAPGITPTDYPPGYPYPYPYP